MPNSPITLIELQAQAQQLSTDMQNFTLIVNGDINTSVTLPSGIIVPSVRKVINDIQVSFNNLENSLSNLASGSTQVLSNALQRLTDYDFVVTNPTIDQVITIPNLFVIFAVTVNGLEQEDTDYSRNGNIITLSVLDGFTAGDKISVSYIPSS